MELIVGSLVAATLLLVGHLSVLVCDRVARVARGRAASRGRRALEVEP